MSDSKKVIEGLKKAAEELARYAPMKVNGRCQMYFDGAIHLLKEQETKLLDADKIHVGTVYWMECENVSQVWPIEMHHIRNLHLLNGPEWEDDYGDVWKMPEYNKKWRCWSAKPTDEQRKVVKWDD